MVRMSVVLFFLPGFWLLLRPKIDFVLDLTVSKLEVADITETFDESIFFNEADILMIRWLFEWRIRYEIYSRGNILWYLYPFLGVRL